MNYEIMWRELRKRIGETRKMYYDMKLAGVENCVLSNYRLMCDIESMLDTIERQEEIRDKLKNTFCLENKKYFDLEKLLENATGGYTHPYGMNIEIKSEGKDNVDNH